MRDGKAVVMAEVLHWRNGDDDHLVVVGNPSREAAIDGAGQMQFPMESGMATLETTLPHKAIVDVRTGQVFAGGKGLRWDWSPDVASVFRLVAE